METEKPMQKRKRRHKSEQSGKRYFRPPRGRRRVETPRNEAPPVVVTRIPHPDLERVIHEQLQVGVDYGRFAGIRKPCLFKSGAERLCQAFGMRRHVAIIRRVEDWEHQFVQYEVRVTLVSQANGTLVGEGIGSCNSRETSYARGSAYNSANTILKVACKRALVDATLNALGASGLFTQDIEEWGGAGNATAPGGSGNRRSPSSGAPTRERIRQLWQLARSAFGEDAERILREELTRRQLAPSLRELPSSEIPRLEAWIVSQTTDAETLTAELTVPGDDPSSIGASDTIEDEKSPLVFDVADVA